MRNLNYFTSILFFIILTATSSHSLTINQPVAISGIYISPAEFAELPDYLQVKVKYHYQQREPIYLEWLNKFGTDYQHYHHWAAALVKSRRALVQKKLQQRKFSLNSALRDYDYLLRHCSPNNSLRYYFHYKKAEAFLTLNDPRSAVSELTTSINHKNNFAPAYLSLSECYIRLGMQKESRESLELFKQRTGKESLQ